MHEHPSAPELTLRTADGRTYRFTGPFSVGRGDACDVAIADHHISRTHLRVEWNGRQWTFTDLESSNGVFLRGERVQRGAVEGRCVLHLGGVDGPRVSLDVDYVEPTIVIRLPGQPADRASHPRLGDPAQDVKDKYFGASTPDDAVGEHTRYIRKAYAEIQNRQKRLFGAIVAVLALALVATAGYAFVTTRALRREQRATEEFYYEVRALHVQQAQLEIRLAASDSPGDHDLLRKRSARLGASEDTYEQRVDAYLAKIKVHGRSLSLDEQLILRVTRRFGECELIAPPAYLNEVKRFIGYWKSTKRLELALQRAQQEGYVDHIARAFQEHNLPPHYFYLALQESDFKPHKVGPPTGSGYAKGMWMFIPGTGKDYGLTIGPRASEPTYDALDERFDWQKATRAAARYIKRIYATDAQASGLLVMASYNWGEHRIIDRIRRMPNNPRDRNFWKLLGEHRIPDETYNYVFYIVSAAVIGENPQLFGYQFDNPLRAYTSATTADDSAGRVTEDARVSGGLP